MFTGIVCFVAGVAVMRFKASLAKWWHRTARDIEATLEKE